MTEENTVAMLQGQAMEIFKINGWYLAMGIFLVFAGVAVLVSLVATTLIMNVFIG